MIYVEDKNDKTVKRDVVLIEPTTLNTFPTKFTQLKKSYPENENPSEAENTEIEDDEYRCSPHGYDEYPEYVRCTDIDTFIRWVGDSKSSPGSGDPLTSSRRSSTSSVYSVHSSISPSTETPDKSGSPPHETSNNNSKDSSSVQPRSK